ncbi:MAG: LacI family DNA-binding transcriptional regulator [Trueperaceae bacterium]
MPTIRDVAKEAGVSEGTVSNVFNGRPYVTENTREKVLTAAKRVGYHRNSLAQALRLGKRNVIGLCLRDIGNPTFASIVLGIEAVARQRNFQVILGNSGGSAKTESEYLEEFVSHQVAGIITAPVMETSDLYKSIRDAGIPLVFINERPADVPGDLVKHDYARGTCQAAEHLLRSGHTEIGIVYGPAYAAPGIEQQLAFRGCLQSFGVKLRPELEAFSTFGIDGAQAAARELLSRASPPTALIGSTLAVTLGCLRAIAETRSGVEFVGTGDDKWLGMFPDLTIVRQDPEAVGRSAVARLFSRIDNPSEVRESQEIVLPVELMRADRKGAA